MFLVRYQETQIQSVVTEYTDQYGLQTLQQKEKDGTITILDNCKIRQASTYLRSLTKEFSK